MGWARGVIVLALVARVASAGTTGREQAKHHYEEGAKAYRLGDFTRAADEYRQSYELFPSPLLLYNLGQAHRELGDLEKALHFYRQYLADDPKRELAKEAEERIAELEKRIEEQRRAAEQKVEPPPVAPPAPAPVQPAPAAPLAPSHPVDHPPARPALIAAAVLAAAAVGAVVAIVVWSRRAHQSAQR